MSDKEQFNRSENHPGNRAWTCTDVAPLLLFYMCEELTDFEHAAVEAHLAGCANCAAAFVRERKLQEFVAGNVQPAEQLDPGGLLLAQCRSELEEALDDWEAAEKNSRKFPESLRSLHPLVWLSRQFVAHPAFGTALLVFTGAVFGVMAPQWYQVYVSRVARTEVPVMRVSAPQRLSEQDLANMDLAGINLTPAPNGTGAGTVEMRFTAEKPVVFEGSLDDSEVRRILASMVQNSQKYGVGMRLDCLDALRTHSGDQDVRKILCLAARRDRNPAVRLRALEALQGSASDQAVREALLGAVLQYVESVLQELVRKDPNHYVRIQSALALRHLRPRGTP